MKITNELALPEPIVLALQADTYDKKGADYSVTELNSPPRQAQLKRQHSEAIIEDASDRIYALLGQAVHVILQPAARRFLVKQRFFTDFDGARISGEIDVYDKERFALQDWKVTSYHAISDGPKPEWIAQGNLLAYMMRLSNYPVSVIEYVAIFRDWSKLKAARGRHDYPARQVQVLQIPLWTTDKIKAYLSERIRLHREAATQLPMCTPEERWERPTKFAHMKEGRKKAIKLYDNLEQAEAAVRNGKVGDYVEERPGENVRCLHYCPVSAFCDFGREQLANAQTL
jgi:hypothetical protein